MKTQNEIRDVMIGELDRTREALEKKLEQSPPRPRVVAVKRTATKPKRVTERHYGDGRVYLKDAGSTYWIAYYFNGEECRESSKSGDKKVAEKLLRQRLMEIGASRQGLTTFVPNQDKIFVRELLDNLKKDFQRRQIKSLATIEAPLKSLQEFFGHLKAVQVSAKHIDNYIDLLRSENFANHTINNRLVLLGQAYRFAKKRKEISVELVISKLQEAEPRQGFLEPQDFAALISCLPDPLKDFTTFAYIVGWRFSQIALLEWSHVERSTGTIRAPGSITKNKKSHLIALEGELETVIERQWTARQYKYQEGSQSITKLSRWVFHREGHRIVDLRKAWNKACFEAGLPCDVTYKKDDKGNVMTYEKGPKEGLPIILRIEAQTLFHDLRRSSVRNMVRAGVSENTAMRITGHRTNSIFKRYDIVDEKDLREAVSLTEQYRQTRPSERRIISLGKKA